MGPSSKPFVVAQFWVWISNGRLGRQNIPAAAACITPGASIRSLSHGFGYQRTYF